MSGIKHIFRKEMARIFRDKKMIFSTFILPVIVTIGMIYLVGMFMGNMMEDIENHVPIVYIENMSENFRTFLSTTEMSVEIRYIINSEHKNAVQEALRLGEADLLIIFSEDFDAEIENFYAGGRMPQVRMYYNPSEDFSRVAYYDMLTDVMEPYRQSLLAERFGDLAQFEVFLMNLDDGSAVIQDDYRAGGRALGMMLPYFITMLLFTGAMGLGVDMIAGEKDRGTMASLLVSPIKRYSIVLGKVFSLMVITGISAMVYAIAMLAALPILNTASTANVGGEEAAALSFNFELSQLLMIGGVLVTLSFLYSSIVALISVFSRTAKEASIYGSPITMLVLALGLSTMFSTGVVNPMFYFIPMYNTSIILQDILTRDITMLHYVVSIGTTFGLGLLFTLAMVRGFYSEKVMNL